MTELEDWLPMNVNQYFPHQVCINLDRRPDRWERVQRTFSDNGIEHVVRFPALDGKHLEIPAEWNSFPGAYGCLLSHLKVVEHAQAQAKPSVLIFEDDVVLANDFNTQFAESITQLPDDWDMVLFGAIHGWPLTKVSDNVVRVNHSLSTYAYALKHTIYADFIEVNKTAQTVLDENTRALQKRFNCYCFMPHLAWVEADYSDVRDEMINLWWLKESFVLFSPEVQELLQHTVVVLSYHERHSGSRRNLLFMVDYLFQALPQVTIVVCDRGREAKLKQSDLPPYCRLECVGYASGGASGRVVTRVLEMVESSKDFFVVLDSDVFLTRDDIKANLLKCLEYDFARSFREVCDLNEAETLRLLSGDLRWDRNSAHPSDGTAELRDASFVVTRNGMRTLAENQRPDSYTENSISQSVQSLLRVYESPTIARRLFSG